MPTWFLSALLLLGMVLPLSVLAAQAGKPDVRTVIQQCYYKEWGRDQRSRLLFRMRNNSGRVTKKRKLIRFWKDYRGRGDVASKMMLFTVAPPEYRGNNYLRINYTPGSGRRAEQWVYLKRLQSVRRLSIREQDNMDWGIIGEDLTMRQFDEDAHVLTAFSEAHGHTAYEVESRPRLENSAYSRYVSHYVRTAGWDSCILTHRDSYDQAGNLIKRADFTWRRLGDAWAMDSLAIVIERPPRQGAKKKKKAPVRLFITYRFTEPEVNIGLKDSDFSQRNLQRGIR
ncbi:MAG: outer membrane lipoprotein-sorting protein [Gammaproteobacteria bacterium]